MRRTGRGKQLNLYLHEGLDLELAAEVVAQNGPDKPTVTAQELLRLAWEKRPKSLRLAAGTKDRS